MDGQIMAHFYVSNMAMEPGHGDRCASFQWKHFHRKDQDWPGILAKQCEYSRQYCTGPIRADLPGPNHQSQIKRIWGLHEAEDMQSLHSLQCSSYYS